MSFGWSGSDIFLLTQLAWSTVQNSRKACGEYDELTREALRLHAVLERLEHEVAKPDSPINRGGGTSKDQLEHIATDCEVVLKQVDKIVMAYAALSEEKRSVRKIWQRVRFGNGQMADLGDLRSKLTLYTSEMLLYLNFVSMSTVGRIEQRMERDGGVLRDIKIAVEKKTAHTVLCGGDREGTILTTYTDDDTGFWKGLRRDLVKEGLPSAAINKHKHLIKKYIKELGDRGILDDHSPQELNQQYYDALAKSEIMEEVEQLANGSTATSNVIQTPGHNLETRLSEDLNEQSPHDSLNDTLRIDRESKSLSTDSCATVLQTLGEQSYEATEELGITPGAKFKSQPRFGNFILREPTHTGKRPQNVPSTGSVLSMHREERPRTSMNEARRTHSHTANSNDDECGALEDGAVYDQSSHDVLFPSFITKFRIDFVVTPSGICYQRNMELYHKDVYWLYVDFGHRIHEILDCLPDRCVPDCSLQPPQTVPGYDPSYSADVQTIANYAHSAQEIIRGIDDMGGKLPTSLIDFRSKDFIVDTLAPDSGTWIRDDYLRRQQPMFVRIHKLIEDFDRQCYDIIHRIKRCISTKTSAYIHSANSSNPPLVHMGAPLNVPNQEHPFPDAKGIHALPMDSHIKSNSNGSSSSNKETCSSALSPELNYPSKHRAETIPLDRTRRDRREAERASEARQRIQRTKLRGKERRRNTASEFCGKFDSYVEEESSDTENPIPLGLSDQNTCSANYQFSPNTRPSPMRREETLPVDRVGSGEKEPERAAEAMQRDWRTRLREKGRPRANEKRYRSKFAPSVDDSLDAESPVPLSLSSLKTTKALSDTCSDTENPVPSRSSNLKTTKAPSDTSPSSSESDSEMTELPLPRPPPIPRKITYAFSQEGAYVMTEQPLPRPPPVPRKTTYAFSQEGAYVIEPSIR